ncbi:Eco57I restriction-modification methylase domain-containing protein [Desulfotomaculum copahuensis]|uniref:site-specific DNA-methyltransferase (adenine-specific) n=1 Tax=Desulfotomaculum copahuensis TaxID=1838280 RepID=A0A1B7LGA2_9FIRM|nr:N-6 DNA methylase [Desulfotomaculum copahuensis]OAT84767.1 hypothetical protein A6M21_17435 [Desulfotomaculum copahuensis]
MENNCFPAPIENERPTVFADRLGQWFGTNTQETRKKNLGQYLTPIPVADFMSSLFTSIHKDTIKLLDPGAGTGTLCCAFCEKILTSLGRPSKIDIIAYEIDPDLCNLLERSLNYLTKTLALIGVTLNVNLINSDFIIDNSKRLQNGYDAALTSYDYIIANPPYFKINKDDPRAVAASSVVYGQPNIYGLFMAVSASLLKPGGELVFITPRSYATGTYFRLVRDHFFSLVRPEHFHLFGSRRDAFDRDSVLQENVILRAVRHDEWSSTERKYSVSLSYSEGMADLVDVHTRQVDIHNIVNMKSKDKMLCLPITQKDEDIITAMHSWSGSLNAYKMEISTGPVVPFRAKGLLRFGQDKNTQTVPLLWMQNVQAMDIKWPLRINKEQYMVVCEDSASLLVPNSNYVLLRRFSSKEQDQRLTAAPLVKGMFEHVFLGLENHLNFIYRTNGELSNEEAYGLAAIYNSSILDSYFRAFNGNTQVNATEIRLMPLPPLEVIREIGAYAIRVLPDRCNVNEYIKNRLVINAEFAVAR